MNIVKFNIALPKLGDPNAPNAARIDLAIYDVSRISQNISSSTDLDSEVHPDRVEQFYMDPDQLQRN